ncbi:hypothetical protein ACFSCX_16140 [Bacillus salitolerans]|uniref:Uncharacterized protein n=1 Tax=Bacillus salitolerans TaxID=1437434 RepID=A0ABW4LT86_9BACI
MLNDTVQIIKDEKTNGHYLLEVNGFILSEKEMVEIAKGILRFLEQNNQSTIDQMNDEILLKYEELSFRR